MTTGTLHKDLCTFIIITYSYLLTPRCRVLLKKLIDLQLVKKFPAFHGTRSFITALTSTRQKDYFVSRTNIPHVSVS
jgi:hypothetical protein